MNITLEKLVVTAEHISDMLYEIQDSLSEATFLECFNNNQFRLRDKGYHNVADAFLLDHAVYQEYRMNNPFSKVYHNIRRGDMLGKMVILGEDPQHSTKMVGCHNTYWLEGNTIHQNKK
jgi:hypothetical protein